MNAQAAPRARIGSLVVALFAVFAVVVRPAGAQTWDFDARTIALGGVSGSGTLASDMIQQEAAYRAIVLPFGLFQVLPDLDIYDPGSPRFDPVRAVEHAASPLHFIVDRDNGVGDGPLASTIAAAQFYAGRAADDHHHAIAGTGGAGDHRRLPRPVSLVGRRVHPRRRLRRGELQLLDRPLVRGRQPRCPDRPG
jgi:hypothetical protein